MNTIDSLYIHFPLCRHLCNYCDFYKTAPSANERSEKISEFHNHFGRSFTRLNNLMIDQKLEWSALDTLYIGGGTPSLWGEDGAKFLKNFIAENLKGLKKDCEATLEVNPGTWTEQGLNSFIEAGFNRFSLGVQSTKDNFLEKLDRVHRKDEVLKTLSYFKKINANFSVDFMLGLPFSKEDNRDILAELEEILSFGPSHLSLYILTVKENYIHYKNLPDEEWIEKEFLDVSSYLTSRGYEHYEVSNFALKGKKSRHNSKYWVGESIAALGPSATGFFSPNNLRFKWKALTPEVDLEFLSDSEVRMEKFYLGLRTSLGISLDDFFKGTDLQKAQDLIKTWQERELCHYQEDRVILTPRGYLLMDSLMDEIFSHTKDL